MEHELKFKESSPDSRMVIPSEVLEESGISAAQCAELHQLRHCVAVLQGKLTAYELIEVILDLNKMSEFLVVQLAKACGTCDGCGDCANENKKIDGAKRAIEQIAKKNHATVEEVRLQIKVSMINGLVSEDPKIKSFWQSIPCEGEIPTPEELIAYTADIVRRKTRGE
jgi:hypothetical protein